MDDEKAILALLFYLGTNRSYHGFHYAVHGVQMLERDCHIQAKTIYYDIARRYNTSWHNVERDVRTLVDVIWNYGNRELLEIIFGRPLNRKPKNKEFLKVLAAYSSGLSEAAAAKEPAAGPENPKTNKE